MEAKGLLPPSIAGSEPTSSEPNPTQAEKPSSNDAVNGTSNASLNPAANESDVSPEKLGASQEDAPSATDVDSTTDHPTDAIVTGSILTPPNEEHETAGDSKEDNDDDAAEMADDDNHFTAPFSDISSPEGI